MLDIPPGNLGAEFYAVVDTKPVADICTSSNWDALRSGEHSVVHAVFPFGVRSPDVLLLPEAISATTREPTYQLPNELTTIIGVEGMWGACLLPFGFVSAIASVPTEHASRLQRAWTTIHNREYEADSDFDLVASEWLSAEMLTATRALLNLGHVAMRDELKVVEIWTL